MDTTHSNGTNGEEGRDGRVDWRLRDKELIESVRIHPRTTNQIDDLGIFPSYAMLTRRLRRLRRRGTIRHQGTIQLKDAGRPVDWYCAWTVNRGSVEHELDLSDVCLMIDGEWKRGRSLSSEVQAETKHRSAGGKKKAIWPDAILVRAGLTFYVEFDSGEQRGSQLKEKFEGYAGFRHRLLFVTKGGMQRLGHVVEHAKPVENFALFTTYDLVMDSEDDAIWYGASLRKAIPLPR